MTHDKGVGVHAPCALMFDVPIPAGAKLINLVAMDAGNGSREDVANWANAGFVVER